MELIFIQIAVEKLRAADQSLKVEEGDITNLKYEDGAFRYLLAFGLYHNLESGLEDAIMESWRVLEKGGRICASFRADNLQTRITDWVAERKTSIDEQKNLRQFHKLNLTRGEFISTFKRVGFKIEKSSLWKICQFFISFPFSDQRGTRTSMKTKQDPKVINYPFLGK